MNIKETVLRIRREIKSPLIGVIGATIPLEGYIPKDGVSAGFYLRKFLESNEGNLFTGGVSGVGTDVYAGIVKYCIRKRLRDHVLPPTRTFLLVPYKYELSQERDDDPDRLQDPLIVDYNPPSLYEKLSKFTLEKKLTIVRAGQDMFERRQIMGNLADIIIMINGGYGTLEEAIFALNNNSPVITLENSGGAATVLSAWKRGSYKSIPQEENPIDRIEATKKRLIYPISSIENIEETLRIGLENTN